MTKKGKKQKKLKTDKSPVTLCVEAITAALTKYNCLISVNPILTEQGTLAASARIIENPDKKQPEIAVPEGEGEVAKKQK